MLSVAKLRVGQEAYQLSGVAQSLDDYYTGAGEAAGQWVGAGPELLGLDGEVDPDDLRAVLAGIVPGTGGLTPNGETPRPHPRRVPGFDLTFKAPKSVSVLYGVSDDPRVQAAIIEAGQAAVSDALAWLEREAINVRRGTGNEAFLNDLAARDPEAAAAARIRRVPAHGVVAASFRHRTSRAGDPLLHWHALVANLAPGPDGRWTAFVHPDLYRAVRAAGEVFQASLRAELTAALGVDWRPGRHVPEIAGVPDALCELFSKRSQQISDWLEATGTPDTPAGRQAAVLATRRGKPEVEHQRFDTAWKAEAVAAGWGPAEAEALLAVPDTAAGQRHPADRLVPPVDDAWIHEIARALTEFDSTFGRPQLAQAVAAQTPTGAPASTVDRLVAAVLADPSIVPVSTGSEPRWTTTDLLAIEGRFLDTVARSRGLRAPVASDIIDSQIADAPSLGDDQAAAVRALARSTDAVSVLVGPAGTGKTFTLDTLRVIHQTAGHRKLCAAASAVVVMTRSGRDRLIDGFGVDPSKVHVIAHGAATPPAATRPAGSRGRPRLLTWGLLGPGKGIEWAIDALLELGGMRPFPEYLVAGATHPKVKEHSGEEYRNMLIQRAWAAGVSPHVSFDDAYRDLPALTELITSADLVVLPYDSDEQVTSGVLVDAVAAGRPVVSTAFPHATELLASGAGIVVPQRDPVALASAIRAVLSDPDLAADMAAEARRLAPDLSWGAVAGEYAQLAERLCTVGRTSTR